MPKNKGNGGKTRRKGKSDGGNDFKREITFKEDGQEYCQITKMLGNGRCDGVLLDGQNSVVMAHIRGKMRKRVWITTGDIVLVGVRDFQDGKVDIIHKYNSEEARNLKNLGEIPMSCKINEGTVEIMENMDGDEEDEEGAITIDFESI